MEPIEVHVDPTVELVSVVYRLANAPEYRGAPGYGCSVNLPDGSLLLSPVIGVQQVEPVIGRSEERVLVHEFAHGFVNPAFLASEAVRRAARRVRRPDLRDVLRRPGCRAGRRPDRRPGRNRGGHRVRNADRHAARPVGRGSKP